MHLDQTFWVAASFIAFVIAAYKPISRFIAGALDNRSLRIQKELGEAIKLREEAQGLLVSFQRKQRDALKEAEEIIHRAKTEADMMFREAEQALERSLNHRIEQAMQKISQSERTVIQDVKNHAVDVAISAARMLLAEQLSAAASDKMFGDALKDIRKKMH